MAAVAGQPDPGGTAAASLIRDGSFVSYIPTAMALQDLTPKQLEVVQAIRKHFELLPTVSPTLRELGESLGGLALGTIQVHLKKIREAGWVTWTPHSRRTLVFTEEALKYFRSH